MKKHIPFLITFPSGRLVGILAGILALLTVASVAWGARLPLRLEKVHIDLHDEQAIRRGARYFKSKCMACHAIKYLRYDPIALSEGLRVENMPTENASWSVMPPPDLSLVGQTRGADWLYTYLHSFYQDKQQPLGTNNLLIPNTSMPHVLQWEQGTYERVQAVSRFSTHSLPLPRWFNLLKQTQRGHQSAEEFHKMVKDIVTFLAYASQPETVKRKRVGLGVCLFLLLFAIPVWFLKNRYWRA